MYLAGGVVQRTDSTLQIFMKLSKVFIDVNTVYQSVNLTHTSDTSLIYYGSLFCMLLGSWFSYG